MSSAVTQTKAERTAKRKKKKTKQHHKDNNQKHARLIINFAHKNLLCTTNSSPKNMDKMAAF